MCAFDGALEIFSRLPIRMAWLAASFLIDAFRNMEKSACVELWVTLASKMQRRLF